VEALVIAGGQGVRLRPLTNTRPKPLLPFMGAPFALGLLGRLAASGAAHASFLVGPEEQPWRPLIKAGLRLGIQVTVHPEEVPLATAGGCRRLLARRPQREPVLVCNGDVLTDLDYGELLARHVAARAVATIALARVEDTASFGVVVRDDAGWVRHCVEKPLPGTVDVDTVNAGTYVLEPDALASFPAGVPLSFEGSIFPGLVDAGKAVLGLVCSNYWQDLGTPERYLAGHRAVLEGRCAWSLPPGLRLAGGLVAVHERAAVAASARLGPVTVVGAGCTIAEDAVVAGSVLHDGVMVGRGAWVADAVIGEGARIAAGVRVVDSVVGDGAIIEAAGLDEGSR
jgi:NDP-sugar pyrophosphorylase family protein